tara:strand:- start:290 stop:439 length:150 start_codon:yes stop_codon:yes gene_type:complete
MNWLKHYSRCVYYLYKTVDEIDVDASDELRDNNRKNGRKNNKTTINEDV